LDAAIALLAKQQHGVIALWQLKGLGLGESGVRHRIAAGKLHRIHRGVYAVGHSLLSMDGRRVASVLACGRTAAASHRMAAALHAIVNSSALEVTVPTRAGRRIPGIVIHRTRCLYAQETTAIDAAIEGNPGRRGAKRLLAVIADFRPGTTRTKNDIEDSMLAICDGIGAPRPLANAWIPFDEGGGASPDFLWPKPKRIVEVDGFEIHGTRRSFEDDRRRDRRLKLMGYEVIRFTWRDVILRRGQVEHELVAFLALR
jgi:hypothetical protein